MWQVDGMDAGHASPPGTCGATSGTTSGATGGVPSDHGDLSGRSGPSGPSVAESGDGGRRCGIRPKPGQRLPGQAKVVFTASSQVSITTVQRPGNVAFGGDAFDSLGNDSSC